MNLAVKAYIQQEGKKFVKLLEKHSDQFPEKYTHGLIETIKTYLDDDVIEYAIEAEEERREKDPPRIRLIR